MKKIIILVSFMFLLGHAKTAVIANSEVGEAKLSKSQLIKIWSKKKSKSSSGTKFALIDNKSGTKSAFYDFIGKSQKSYKKLWMKYQLAGKGKGAKAVSDDSSVISKVKSTDGAIGFVDEAAAKASGLKILLVIP
jgi:ABC-type phosphate transport system substrate-binding protein